MQVASGGAVSRPNGRKARFGRRLSSAQGDAAATVERLHAQIRTFFENTRDCVFALGRDWRFTFLNRRAIAEISGGRNLLGTSIWESFPEAVDSPFEHAYRRAMGGSTSEAFDAYFAPLGAWYEVQAVPVDAGILVTFRNINDRKASEARLRETEERYRLAARATNDLIRDWNLHTDHISWNEALDSRMGYGAEQLGTTGDWWRGHVHPEDRERIVSEIDAVIASGGEQFVGEYRFRRADGHYADILERSYVVRDAEGKPLRLVGAMQEVTEHKQAVSALGKRERQLAMIFGQAMVGILHRSIVSDEIIVNERFCQIIGRTAEELRNLPHGAFTHPDDLGWHIKLMKEHMRTGEPLQAEKRYVRPDGTIVWCNVHFSFVRENGVTNSYIVVVEEITDRRAAEQELRASRNLLQTVIDSITDMIYVKDMSGRFVLTNRALDEATGGKLKGRSGADVFSADVIRAYEDADLEVVTSGRSRTDDETIPVAGGPRAFHTVRAPWLSDGRIAGVIGVSRDMTERLQADERVRWSATHDALTNLPNRVLFQQRLSQAIDQAAATGGKVGLLQLDVDQFKQVNDSVGHDAGDVLLCTFGERLRSVVRASDTVGRTGGDEFTVILPGLSSDQDMVALAEAILQRLREPFVHSGHVLDCRASIGASIYPRDGSSAEELLKSADIALYKAKSAGRGMVILFEPEMRADVQKRNSMVMIAQDAIADDRIQPFYQPKTDLASGHIIGFEALLRWYHPRHGVQLPADICAAFEDLKVASELSERMFERTIIDIRNWLNDGVDFGHIAVNASAAEFRRDDFAERLLERLSQAGIPTRHFQIEVTESVFLGRGAEYVDRALKLLASEGIRIALDDFGTGYASLRHLRQFPVHTLKIDQSFVRDMTHDPDDAAIIQAVLDLGRSLGISVVAEGVETREQVDHLLRLGCRYGQGFFYSQAAPVDQVTELIHIHGR